MSLLERYRGLYEHEKDCNHKMLAMLELVPEANRSDARFQQAVAIAGHLAACREFWLEHMGGKTDSQVAGLRQGLNLPCCARVSPPSNVTGQITLRACRKTNWHRILNSPNEWGALSVAGRSADRTAVRSCFLPSGTDRSCLWLNWEEKR